MNTRSRTRLPATALAAAVLVALAACASPGDADAPDSPAAPDDPGSFADGTDGDWRLLEGVGPEGQLPIPDEASITLIVDGDSWGGTAACNSYGATVTVDGDQVSISGLAATEMACADVRLMDAEAAYLAALQAVDTIAHEADRLVLMGPGVTLAFGPVEPAAAASLVGTDWRLEALIDASVAGDDDDTTSAAASSVNGDAMLTVSDDGSVSGSTGCNRFMGDVEVDGSSWRAGPLAATRMACGDALTRQEQHVLGVLDGTATVDLDGDRLTLTDADGRGLVYRATDPADG